MNDEAEKMRAEVAEMSIIVDQLLRDIARMGAELDALRAEIERRTGDGR